MIDSTSISRAEKLELFISQWLRYGVLLAGALIFAGWLAQVDFTRDNFAEFSRYQRVPLVLTLQTAWAQGAWAHLLAYLGLAVLIALPMTRVAFTLVIFLKERDFLLAATTGLVFLGLLLSLALGFDLG